MAIGKLVEELYLVSLPQNCTFTVTKLEDRTQGEWYTYFTHSKKTPYTVEPKSGQKAFVVESGLSTQSSTDSGEGLSNKLYFTVSGSVNNKQFERKGCITFSSTDWPGSPYLGRPDYSILQYGFEDGDQLLLSQQVPTLISPDPYYIAFAIKDDQICMAASREHSLTSKVMSNILDGILKVHTKAIGWVFGKLW